MLPLAVLGDSSGQSVGVLDRHETAGGYLARRLVSELSCSVEVEVLARAGVTTAGMARQVRALVGRPERGVVLILIGGNDVLLPTSLKRASARLGRYVRELRAAGWEVVVGSCADIGAAPALYRGAAVVATFRSRRLARRQTVAVLRAGGLVVSLATGVFRHSPGQLYCPDGFHPSPEGYLHYFRRIGFGVVEAGRARLGLAERSVGPEDRVLEGTRTELRRLAGERDAYFIPAASRGGVVMRRYCPALDHVHEPEASVLLTSSHR
ncbi:SGNH/GDSL hydrolase family protein [Streptomyces sp. H27-S2]|uniref:SGNH/GDSL hydrolase family protein n=1 Tax=Streptomyces antarcticus TaxID=2996458 RepID=UPI002271B3A4|nr:SGNH/GDSL hydrolase family protein [Streptomyces sp. H27-S2]MCY0954785.1 SGNH/GDSL hydrolase family protein [Streptomyces sp. H27-S2]